MEYKCKKCGSKNLFTEKIVDATGLYCRECGAFQKYLREDELHVFKHTQSVNSNLSSTKSSPKMPPLIGEISSGTFAFAQACLA